MALAVRMVVPSGIDDPRRPSGGNRYDRTVIRALRDIGWHVDEVQVPGSWPHPDSAGRRALQQALQPEPSDAARAVGPVVVDGLLASAAPDVVVAATEDRPITVLVHMPLGPTYPKRAAAEQAMLAGVDAVVATSGWTARWLADSYRIRPDRIHIARPGADPAPLAAGSAAGGRLLYAGAVTQVKGVDVLLAALRHLDQGGWRCTMAGPLEIEPAFAGEIRREALDLGDRVRLTGPLDRADIEAAYGATDLLVVPSRFETWGMVVTEALARGIPVVASDVGGMPESLGRAADGAVPGLLVPPGDPGALASALQAWLGNPELRTRLRQAARQRRVALPGWSHTARRLAEALREARGRREREDVVGARGSAIHAPGAGRRWPASLSP